MNAGRLHTVLELIRRDYEKNETVARLQSAAEALATSVRSPNEANATAFRDALGELYSVLDRSPLNFAVPSQLQILREIGGVDKVGEGLRAEIQNTLDTSAVTPAKAQAELQRILEVVSGFADVVLQLVTGFEALKVPYEVLEPGETEIGATVPWEVIRFDLDGLQKNLHRYDLTWKTFGELVEENSASPTVRSVGSSALQIFINSTPGIALCVATAIERLCALYKQILEIRVLKKKVQEQALPEAVSESITAHEQTVADTEIDKIIDDLLKEFRKGKPAGRSNELRTGLKTALRFLASQIDSGVDLEVRSEPPTPRDVANTEGESVKSDKTKRALEHARQTAVRIQRAGASMKALSRTAEPVLALEFREEEETSSP